MNKINASVWKQKITDLDLKYSSDLWKHSNKISALSCGAEISAEKKSAEGSSSPGIYKVKKN